ncbi:MAG: PilZ domain-containing protein [Planctomycetota bacterium]
MITPNETDPTQPHAGLSNTGQSRAGHSAPDRRREARTPAVRPAKVLHIASRKYAVAETVDISDRGLLLRVEPGRPLHPGDEIKVAIAWQREGVLSADSMQRARVVRVARVPGQAQAVAIELVHSGALARVA